MSLKTKQQALMYVFGKRLKGIVDVEENKQNWAGYPTYLVRYEICGEPGHYVTMEFLPSKQTELEIQESLAELEYQAQGLELEDYYNNKDKQM